MSIDVPASLSRLPGRLSYRDGADADYLRLKRGALIRMLFDIHAVRSFERQLLDCAARGEVTGPIHTAIGQEGVPAAVLGRLEPADQVVGNHRSHHHFLVQGLARTVDEDWDPLTSPLPGPAQDHLDAALAEMLGRTAGVSSGVGGSMHLRAGGVGFVGSSAIVGGGIPLAAGVALAQRLRRTGGIAVCFIGDGAVNQGTFHETANLARLLRLPMLIVVENNGYAEATRPDEASAVLPLATQGSAHGLPSVCVQGGDPVTLYRVAEEVLAEIRQGGGPALLDVETYRHLDHTGAAAGSTAGYRDVAEERDWLRRDPLTVLPAQLLALGLLSPGDETAIAAVAQEAVNRSYAAAGRPGAHVVAVLDQRALLRAPSRPTPGAHPAPAPGPAPGAVRRLRFRDAIAEGIARALRRSPDVVLIGEEVSKPGGLLWPAGCLDAGRVGSQIINTPISEAAFVGMAGGAAMAGLRPIVELMYGSFALIAADQLFNHIGAVRALYGNTAHAPVIVRAKVPTGLGYGPQHGLNPAGLFHSFPGWRVHAPADPRDYLGVLNSALQCDDPVLLVEFSPLYDEVHELSDADFAAELPLHGARHLRRGDDITLVTYGLGTRWTEAAAATLAATGCAADVIDLRALDAMALDWDTITESAARTGRVLFVDPAARGQAIGPRLIADLLDRTAVPPRLAYLACADVQPVTPVLERQAIVGPDDVVRSARRLLGSDDLAVGGRTVD